MRITCDRQRLVIALTAVLVGFELPARPFGIVGRPVEPAGGDWRPADARRCGSALSRRSRLFRYGHLRAARAAGVRALVLKNHYQPISALVLLLRRESRVSKSTADLS